MGRRKTGKKPISLSIDCLSDIFPFCHGDLQTCQNFSLVSRAFFLVAKKYLYKDNPRIIRAILLRSQFYKNKFVYHTPFKWNSACTEGVCGPRCCELGFQFYACHWGRGCCKQPPLPEVSPPANILGFDKIIIEDFVGKGSEAFTLLRCSRRLFASRKCLLNIGNYLGFLARHGPKRLGELMDLFRHCSSLAVAYDETRPEHYEFMAMWLLNCHTICLSSASTGYYWDGKEEERTKNVAYYAKLAIGNLLTWLHYQNGNEAKMRTLIGASSYLTPYDYREPPWHSFDEQLFEAIKKKFTAATQPHPFCIHLEYSYYNHDFHHYDARAAANRAQHGDGELEWVNRMENERTGELLEHFIYSEHHRQIQHRILRRRGVKCEDPKMCSLSRADYPTFDETEFDTKIELIQKWRRKRYKFGK